MLVVESGTEKQSRAYVLPPMHTAPKPYTDKGCRGWFVVLSECLHFPDYLDTSPPNSPSVQRSERSPGLALSLPRSWLPKVGLLREWFVTAENNPCPNPCPNVCQVRPN